MLHHYLRLNNNLVVVAIGAVVAALSITSCTSVPTPSAKATPTPTPFPFALAGTPVPVPAEAISPENAGRVVQLARWGKGTINQVAWSPDGKQLVVVSAIGIYFYDAQTWQQTRFIETQDRIDSAALSPDGKLLALAGNQIELWDVASGQKVRTFVAYYLAEIAFSPDSKLLASSECKLDGPSLWDCTIKVWDVANGQQVRTFAGLTDGVNSVAFSPAPSEGGQLLASGSDDTIRLWKVANGRLVHTLPGDVDDEGSVVFSPSGQMLASESGDGTVKLWDVESGQELYTISEPITSVAGMAFSPDGKLLATGSNDGTIKLWDLAAVASGRQVRAFSPSEATGDMKIAGFSPDGELLAVQTNDVIDLWQVASGQRLYSMEGYSDMGNVAFSPDGRSLASGSWDSVKLWDVASGYAAHTFSWNTRQQRLVAFQPAPHEGNISSQTLAIGAWDGTLELWEIAGEGQDRTLVGPTRHAFSEPGSRISGIAFSPDGKLLATAPGVNLLDLSASAAVTSGRQVRTLVGNTRGLESVAFSPDGKTLAAGSMGFDAVVLWDTASGRELYTIETEMVENVAFSPDGKLLVSGGRGDAVKLWNVADGHLVHTLPDRASGGAAFSPSGHVLAVGGYEAVRLWDVASGRELRVLEGHNSFIESVTFSPDGKLLVTGSLDGTVRLWGVR